VTSRRPRPALVTSLGAVALLGTIIALALSQGSGGGAGDPTVQHLVKSAIEAKVPRGVSIHGLSCEATSNSAMTCVGDVANRQGTAVATYTATIDPNTGGYKLNPIVSVRPTSRRIGAVP
jgi:hypothetical protein